MNPPHEHDSGFAEQPLRTRVIAEQTRKTPRKPTAISLLCMIMSMHANNHNLQLAQDDSSMTGSSISGPRVRADPRDPPKHPKSPTMPASPIDQVRASAREGRNDSMAKGKAPGYQTMAAKRPSIQVIPGVQSTRQAHVSFGTDVTKEYMPLEAQFPDLSKPKMPPPDRPPSAAPRQPKQPALPPGLPPGVPPPESGETFAGWFTNATKGRALVLLRNPKNTYAFTDDDVQTSVKTTCLLIDPEWTGSLTVTGFGTGPWQVGMDEKTANMLVEGEYVDLFSITNEDKECEFTVDLCDPHGRPIRQQAERAAEREASRTAGSNERRERLDNNEARARLKKAREMRLFIDGPPATTMMGPQDRKIYFNRAVGELKTALNASAMHVGPDRVNHTMSTTKSGAATNTAIVWITLPEGELTETWMHTVQWHRYKYIQVGKGVPPAKLRVQSSLANDLGLKPCCYLPRCAGPGYCLAHKDAYVAAGCQPPQGEGGFRFDLPPTHEQANASRKHARQVEIEDRQAKEARIILERSMRKRACIRWRNGICHRTAVQCRSAHGTDEEAKKIHCHSATKAGRKSGFKCPSTVGTWYDGSTDKGEDRCPFNLICECVEDDQSDDDGLQKGNEGEGDADYTPHPSS